MGNGVSVGRGCGCWLACWLAHACVCVCVCYWVGWQGGDIEGSECGEGAGMGTLLHSPKKVPDHEGRSFGVGGATGETVYTGEEGVCDIYIYMYICVCMCIRK